MKPWFWVLLVVQSGGPLQAAEHNGLTAEEKASGWQLLFDGEATDGWRNYRSDGISDGWQVVGGNLTRVAKGGDIVTVEEYADFELKLEWRVEEGGNSGIFFRANEDNDYIFMSAPEMQILDDANHRDGKSELTSAGSNYGLHPAPRGVVKPAGEWNYVRLLVEGPNVTQWMNGGLIVGYALGSPDWLARVADSKFKAWPDYGTMSSGFIGLQDHGDPVSFRNIKIRVID